MPLAMPAATRFVLNTGPSAASLALLAYVCVRLRCGLLFGMVAAVPVVELIIWPAALAGHGHLAAVVIGAIAALPRRCGPLPARCGLAASLRQAEAPGGG
jgi:hypothetical protein